MLEVIGRQGRLGRPPQHRAAGKPPLCPCIAREPV